MWHPGGQVLDERVKPWTASIPRESMRVGRESMLPSVACNWVRHAPKVVIDLPYRGRLVLGDKGNTCPTSAGSIRHTYALGALQQRYEVVHLQPYIIQ